MKRILKVMLAVITIFSMFTPFTYNRIKAISNTYTYAYINATELGVRECPSTECNRLKHDEGGTIWLYRPRVVEVIGTQGEWSKINFNYWGFNYTGFVLTSYLGDKRTVNLDQNYANELRNKGFPESYIEKLCKMHAIHPNWNFEVSNTGVKLDDAVNGEYNPIYKNLISTSNKNQLSTDPGAYSNGVYTQFEPGWYAPSKETLKYYMDPRNFLDDNSIFMFEQLSFNESQNESVVQAILNGTFLAGSYSYNGTTKTYASTFVEAGRQYGVSPVHLAARVIQEQGTNGSATTAMDGGDGKTYYNYFNFGASGSSLEQIVGGALAYAKNRNWDSPYASIMGGASGIANGYISNKQDTLYYEKFNIIGGSQYWHQYMANIQAPYKESYTTYNSYWKSNLTNLQFTFKIPVYTDMGEGTQIATKSNNANLSSISYSTGVLYPSFDSSITSYTLEVSSNTQSVNFGAVTAHNKANVISGIGTVNITSDEVKREIIVSAEDGTKRTYEITIKRADATKETPDKVIEFSGYNNSEDNLTGFTVGEDISKVINHIKSKSKTATVKATDVNNNEITSGLVATGEKIIVTNNGQSKTYTIIIKGDTNGDGKISAIDYSKVKAHILKLSNLNGSYALAADTSSDGKISAIDYSKVKAHILKLGNLVQR